MTVCVYYKNTLACDGLMTTSNGDIVQNNITKIGMVYECVATGLRSLYPESLKCPVEFAMYSYCGTCKYVPKFLRWFVSNDHPIIDDEYQDSFPEPETVEDSANLGVLVVFKNYNIVRLYDGDYTEHTYIDFNKDHFLSIGSGSHAASSIHNYDKDATPEEIVKAVFTSVSSCGGEVQVLEFSEDPKYTIKYLPLTYKEKIKNIYIKYIKR